MARRLAAALICLGLAAPLALGAAAQDAPIATSQEAAPAPKPAAPESSRPVPTAPTDDYGYVAWCLGAVSGYIDQYDKAMPEVIRIERAFPTPSTEENIAKVYPEQRDAAKASVPLYQAALTAAEKASTRPINAVGAQAVARGRAVWTGPMIARPAQLAQFWMGWAAPADCDTRAKTLQAKSALLGQLLTFNATAPAEVLSASTEALPVEEAKVAEAAPAPAVAETPAAPEQPAPAAPPPAEAPPLATAASGKISIDSLLEAAANGAGASADAVLRGRR